jgi:hypothetical protein
LPISSAAVFPEIPQMPETKIQVLLQGQRVVEFSLNIPVTETKDTLNDAIISKLTLSQELDGEISNAIRNGSFRISTADKNGSYHLLIYRRADWRSLLGQVEENNCTVG